MADDQSDRKTAVTGTPLLVPPKTYHHWWFIGIFVAMLLIAGAVYFLANRNGEENLDDATTDYGLKDTAPVNIENFHRLTVPSQISLIDELVTAISQPDADYHDLYTKLIIAYANNDQHEEAYSAFREFEAVATVAEKDFGFYADGTRWALAAGDEQAARNYYDLAINYDLDNQDPDYLTQVGYFRQEMIDWGLIDE